MSSTSLMVVMSATELDVTPEVAGVVWPLLKEGLGANRLPLLTLDPTPPPVLVPVGVDVFLGEYWLNEKTLCCSEAVTERGLRFSTDSISSKNLEA